MRIAVVTIAQGRHQHLQRQVQTLLTGRRVPDHHVVVAMNDAGVAGCLRAAQADAEVVELPMEGPDLPLAAARNAGVRRAIDAGADVLVLLDVDCLAGPGLVDGYLEAVRTSPETIWSGPVTYLPPPPPSGYNLSHLDDLDDPHPARPAPPVGQLVPAADPDLFWSLSCAMSTEAWGRVGGFCEEYRGYGAEDTDFARLAVHRRVKLGWSGTPRAYHQHHPTNDPPVQHLESIVRNATLFRRRWGAWPMPGWLAEFERRGLVTLTPDAVRLIPPPGRSSREDATVASLSSVEPVEKLVHLPCEIRRGRAP